MRNHVFLSLLLIGGCAHKQQTHSTRTQTQAVNAPMTQRPVAKADSQASSAASTSPTECAMLPVHFDFDKSDLHADDRAVLADFARCMQAKPTAHFVVAGNCDERGTQEYNMALGDRRANSVADYLASLGVARDRLRTVSYGKERPICAGHEEVRSR